MSRMEVVKKSLRLLSSAAFVCGLFACLAVLAQEPGQPAAKPAAKKPAARKPAAKKPVARKN